VHGGLSCARAGRAGHVARGYGGGGTDGVGEEVCGGCSATSARAVGAGGQVLGVYREEEAFGLACGGEGAGGAAGRGEWVGLALA
jgi:hypothetical protein